MLENDQRLIYGFPPVITDSAKILILGSMPGHQSLKEQQYYAHPQNAFWRIMSFLFDFDMHASYAERLRLLQSKDIALWDVLHACQRQGSLDSMIQLNTQVPNDFKSLLQNHPRIQYVFFNGGKAEDYFKRTIAASLTEHSLQYMRLPSTSPAHAMLSFLDKLEAWRVIQTL